jgi:hypothetical protein
VPQIIAAIQYHFGESLVRARFQEYVLRFVRVASRYEEEIRGQTSIGFPSKSFSEGRLGSGIVFLDEHNGQKELATNAMRIEAWTKTTTYLYYQQVLSDAEECFEDTDGLLQDFHKSLATTSLEGFDVAHQLWRLRHARNMSDGEVELILRTIAGKMHSYTPVIEVSRKRVTLHSYLLKGW